MNYQFTPAQKKAIDFVMHKKELSDFYMSGGTALAAYYEGHRISDDIDFFTTGVINPTAVEAAAAELKSELGATAVAYQKVFDRRLYFFALPDGDQLKLEFTHYPFNQLEPIQVFNDVRVASRRDVAANKLMTLVDRFDPKDFVDLYFLTRTTPLQEIRADAEKKFGVAITPLTLGSELMKVERITALPKMLKPLDLETLKTAIRELARGLRGEIVED